MKAKKYHMARLFLAALLLLASCAPRAAAWKELPPVDIQAKAALLADPQTDTLLFERNIHERVYPASITKIMTTLLALSHGDLADEVTASETALSGLDPQGSTQNIKAGEVMTLEDLLYCVMVASANEACNVIAEHIAGSVDAFVEMMNAEAERLGCEGTHFTNTHGLHEEDHYTTAWDVYLITREALKNPRFMTIANTPDKHIPPTNMTEKERVLYTTNHLISRAKSAGYIYHQAKGIKTGHTSAAGNCLVSAAEKDGYSYLCVVMGAAQEEGVVRSFTETKALFEWGFDNFETKQIIATSDIVAKVDVLQGLNEDTVVLVPETKLLRLLPKGLRIEDVEKDVTIDSPGGVTAPVKRGDTLGTLTLVYDGAVLGVVPLVAAISVERSQLDASREELSDFMSQPWVRYVLFGLAGAIALYTLIALAYNMARRRRQGKNALYNGRYRGKR